MKEKLIKVKFEDGNKNATIEVPKNILSKIHVNEENPYIYLNYEYGEINIKRGIRNEKKLWTEFNSLIDKYYKYKKIDEGDTYKLFGLLMMLGFIEFNDELKTKAIGPMDILTIETKEYIINIHSDYDVDLN